MVQKTVDRDFEDQKKKHTLGSLRLRHHESNQIILIPTPTNDPNGKHGELSHGPEATDSSYRSAQLVDAISVLHCDPGLSRYLLLQLPGCRTNRRHRRGDGDVLQRTVNEPEFQR